MRTLAAICSGLEGAVILVWSVATLSLVESLRSAGFEVALVQLVVAGICFGLAFFFLRAAKEEGLSTSLMTRILAIFVGLVNAFAIGFASLGSLSHTDYLALRVATLLVIAVPFAFVAVVVILAAFRKESVSTTGSNQH